jgi:hypothetical protein
MARLHLPIQDPCHENWDAMDRDGDSRRFCEACTKHVHDLSSMTERAARSVLADESAKGRVCVRYRMDPAGHIEFKPETVEAPSWWRTSLAAAGMALALMTGCTDSEPDQVLSDKCVYEVGPWTFTANRGQGTCPAVDPEPEHVVQGMIEAIDPLLPDPIVHEVKGDIGPEIATMGEAPVLEPPERVRMGKMPKGPRDDILGGVEFDAEKERIERIVHERMGDVAIPEVEAPCDPAQKTDTPRRL